MPRRHYYYDEKTYNFVPVEHHSIDVILYSASHWILNGVILAAMVVTLLSVSYATPAELVLRAENDILIRQLNQSREDIQQIEEQLDQLVAADEELYRSVLGLESMSVDLRNPGVGGSRSVDDRDLSEETADLLEWTIGKVDELERRVSIQTLSFEEIKAYYSLNSRKMKHLPAIKPVNNTLVSAYGMRDHPVLGIRRLHPGVDFKSSVGSPVYATGDGVIRLAATRGTYGKLIVLDHGFGYESRYAHLSGYANGIRSGVRVKRGDLIGYTGRTGLVKGPHLHYEIYVNGEAVDPLQYLIADTTPEEYQLYLRLSESENPSLD